MTNGCVIFTGQPWSPVKNIRNLLNGKFNLSFKGRESGNFPFQGSKPGNSKLGAIAYG